MEAFLEWFGSRSFMPHGHCYLWRPSILWLHVGSDAVIAARLLQHPARADHEIRIRAGAPAPDVARIVVEDNGRGFPAEAAARLFEPFERAGRDEGGGLGLGLAICRRIARRHGGDIEAAAREDAGARFTIELPLPSEADLDPPADPTAALRA